MKNQKGFTLTELLVVIAIMGILLIPISGSIVNTMKSFEYQSDQIDFTNEARLAFEVINEQIRRTEAENISITSETITYYDEETDTDVTTDRPVINITRNEITNSIKRDYENNTLINDLDSGEKIISKYVVGFDVVGNTNGEGELKSIDITINFDSEGHRPLDIDTKFYLRTR